MSHFSNQELSEIIKELRTAAKSPFLSDYMSTLLRHASDAVLVLKSKQKKDSE